MAPIRPNAEEVSALADAAKLAADAASMAAAAASLLAGEQGPIAAIPLGADPAWRHPCFVDAIAAEFTATHPATTKRLTTALGLGFAADLLQLAASSLAGASSVVHDAATQRVFIASPDASALAVVDVSDPARPTLVGVFTDATSLDGALGAS